jgi:MFS-type transporter involved in bile tolerance (Atg22 family)
MLPASLVANIAILSGVLSALLMPIAGAMVDYTPYRRRLGCVSAFLMILIQAIQIGTVSQTWFPMSILQGLAGFLYQVQVLATYAYLPDIARSVGESTMTRCECPNRLQRHCVCVFRR